MRAIVFILALLCIWLRLAGGAETLTFDASTTPLVGYVLKWGTTPTGVNGIQALDTNRVVFLTNGPWGAFHFKVVAVASNGVESLPSNVLLATNLPAAPLQLRLVPGTNVVYLDATVNGALAWKRVAIITNDPALLAAQRSSLFRVSRAPLPGGAP